MSISQITKLTTPLLTASVKNTLILELLNQSSPVIVKDPKDTTSLFILMPMRV